MDSNVGIKRINSFCDGHKPMRRQHRIRRRASPAMRCPMRVAVYVRVSTSHQVQQQTIEQQLARLRHYVQSQGWLLSEDDIFRDDGYSGATLVRPGLDRLRDKVR